MVARGGVRRREGGAARLTWLHRGAVSAARGGEGSAAEKRPELRQEVGGGEGQGDGEGEGEEDETRNLHKPGPHPPRSAFKSVCPGVGKAGDHYRVVAVPLKDHLSIAHPKRREVSCFDMLWNTLCQCIREGVDEN